MTLTGGPGTSQPRRTVIIAEDASGDIALLAEAFRSKANDISLEFVRDGITALKRISRGEEFEHTTFPDLLILDLGLPLLDGAAVLAQLRLLPKKLPVMVLTGSTKNSDRNECLRLGAVHFAVKPSFFGEWLQLVDFITTYLRRSSPDHPHSTPTPLGSPLSV